MPLSIAERKERLPHGSVTKVHRQTKADMGFVSRAMSGEVFPKTKRTKLKLQRVMKALAAEIGVAVEDAFQPEELERAGFELKQPVG